jgi:hypothetical protein
MGALLQSILGGIGRSGNEAAEARSANQAEKQKQQELQFKLQQFKSQMDELNQRLAAGKAPQYVGSYQAPTGQRINTERNPLTGALSDSPGGQQRLPAAANKPKYADLKQAADGKWWGLNNETQKMEPIPGQDEFKAVQKPQNRDDRYIAIQAKKNSRTPLTKDEQDYESAYDLWVQKTKVDPGVKKAAAFGANRYIPVLDPSDPEAVTFMRAYDAARSGARSPQSIAFQIDKAITKYFTAGPAGTTINYFNTAMNHLNLLLETANALHNGDVQLFNKYGNMYQDATGDPAPNNFNTVRSAVSGELSKTFKGTGATDQEVALIVSTINNAQSPKELAGAIDYYLRLMGGKMDALRGQYAAGKQGSPNFPSNGTTPPPGSTIIKWDDVK